MQRFDIEQGEVLLSIQYTLALEAQRAEPRRPRRPWTPPSWRPEDLAKVVSIAAQQRLEGQPGAPRRAATTPAAAGPPTTVAAGPPARVTAGPPAAAATAGPPATVPARHPAAHHPSARHPSTMAARPPAAAAPAAGVRQAAREGAWVRDVITKSFSSPPPRRPAARPAGAATSRGASELGLLDPATGAGSSRALRRDLTQAFAPASGPPASAPNSTEGVHLVALQVEPLAEVRHREGDAAAERLLKTAVETVGPLLRGHDRIYRTGPNQLALLLRSVGEDGVEAVLARLARQVPTLLAGRGISGVRIVLRRVHVRHSELPGDPTPGTATR